MIKIILFILTFFFTGCLNKHGISSEYYSDCKEYYDLQGFYHKKCSQDDLATYKEIKQKTQETITDIKGYFKDEVPKKETPLNVW